MPVVVVTATPTKREIAIARLGVYFRAKVVRTMVLCSAALAALSWLGPTSDAFRGVAYYPLAGVLLLLPFAVAFAGLWGPTVRAISEKGIHYRFSDENVDTRAPGGTASISWSMLRSAFETSSAIVISAAATTIILPKRCFTDVADVASLRALLASKGLLK